MTDVIPQRPDEHLRMLARRVGQLRARLATCTPRERFEVERALERALARVVAYVNEPCPPAGIGRALHL